MRLTMTLQYFVNFLFSNWEVVFSVTVKNSINLHWAFSFKRIITAWVNGWYLPALRNPVSNVILSTKYYLSIVWSSHRDFSQIFKSKVKCEIIYFDLVWKFVCLFVFCAMYSLFPNNSETWIFGHNYLFSSKLYYIINIFIFLKISTAVEISSVFLPT